MGTAATLGRRIRAPFPGLRSFSQEESELFFGREGQSDKLAGKLGQSRFVAVLGTSGSGKSSLVRAGLLPSLEGGCLVKAGSNWRIVDMRPGGRPIDNLIAALDAAKISATPLDAESLRASSLALLEFAHQAYEEQRLKSQENLLILVDQFEELFRYPSRSMDDRDEKAAFVKLLLQASKQRDYPVYVVITMRSDFLGDCARFRDLPETINSGQYLVPRMSREERREAIEDPIHMAGGAIAPRLVQRILNDVGEDPDQLPLMQHALMRTWYQWRNNAAGGRPVDIEDYEAVGGLENALSSHSDKAYSEALTKVSGRGGEIVKLIFQRLRDRDASGRETRRPTTLAELCAVAEASELDVLTVLECFRREGRSFLTPAMAVALTSDREVDITHESLLRQWKRLQGPPTQDSGWIADEEESRRNIVRLADRAEESEQQQGRGSPDYLRGPLLQLALEWWNRREPNATWAARYTSSFAAAQKYLRDSEANGKREIEIAAERARAKEAARLEQQRRKNAYLAFFVVLSFAAFASAIYAHLESKEAQQARSQDYWEVSGGEQKANHDLEGVQWAAEAIDEDPSGPLKGAILQYVGRILHHISLIMAVSDDGRILSAVFSKDESRILTWNNNNTARLWDAQTGKPITPPLEHLGPVLGATFSKNGILTWSADKTAQVWDAKGNKTLPPLRHGGAVSGAAFNKDESRILTWSADGTARLWDATTQRSPRDILLDTGLQIEPSLKHGGAVSGAAFNKDETKILTWSADGTARLWDATTGLQIEPSLEHGDAVSGAAFNKDETRILTWSADHTAQLWNTRTGDRVGHTLVHEDSVFGAVLSKDERKVLTWSADKTARLWDVNTGKATVLKHDGSVLGAVFSANETRILTWSEDSTARLWDANTGKQIGPALTHGSEVLGAVFSRDESRILTWSKDKTVRHWDARTAGQIPPALYHIDVVRGAVFNKDETKILSWSDDKTARVWDATTIRPMGLTLEHGGSVIGAIFNNDRSRILTWSQDNTARIWDASTGKQIGRDLRHKDSVGGAVFSKDESRILTWSADKTAQVWDAKGNKTLPPLQHEGTVFRAVFNKDESRILTWSEDKTARLWDARSGAKIGKALRHGGLVHGAAFNKDETKILTWSADGTARLWDATTGLQIEPSLEHGGAVFGAAFNKDETRILTWSADHTAQLWNTRTGGRVGHTLMHEDSVFGAVLSKDERKVLTWSADKTARLWDVNTGKATVFMHEDSVFGAVLSKDERKVLTWSADKTARLWDVNTGKATMLKHDGSVLGAAFSKGQSQILSWSKDKTARLWDAETGQMRRVLQHNDLVGGAVFSSDEERILTWSNDKTARQWYLTADLDFPPNKVKVCAQAVTGAALDVSSRELHLLKPEEWLEARKECDRVTQEHPQREKY